MVVDPIQLGILGVLFVLFLMVPMLSDMLGSNLDSLPIRLGVVIAFLAVIPYDRFVALAFFMLLSAIYIHHHQSDLVMNMGPDSDNPYNAMRSSLNGIKPGSAMDKLDHGGHADESVDHMDFIPKSEDQENEFSSVGHTVDEKHVLTSETLGSRSASLFPEDSKNVQALEQGNRGGNTE